MGITEQIFHAPFDVSSCQDISYVVFVPILSATMYVDCCRTGKYKRYLLRESFRQNGRVKHRTIANLSGCSPEEIRAIQLALCHKEQLGKLLESSVVVELQQGNFWWERCGSSISWPDNWESRRPSGIAGKGNWPYGVHNDVSSTYLEGVEGKVGVYLSARSAGAAGATGARVDAPQLGSISSGLYRTGELCT